MFGVDNCYSRLIREMIFMSIRLVPCLFKCKPFLPRCHAFILELSNKGTRDCFSLILSCLIVKAALSLSNRKVGCDITTVQVGSDITTVHVGCYITTVQVGSDITTVHVGCNITTVHVGNLFSMYNFI